jgi:hypothetical protein
LNSASAASSNSQAKAYAERAIEISDSLGQVHSSLPQFEFMERGQAQGELKRGIELNPNYATAYKFYGNSDE